ncbi:hypothetical protein JTB14_037025 [Gonioctena quinquepunctata]|nr:hypothetical protein JTB14_037025 [Gonioctena quinquepunctata]
MTKLRQSLCDINWRIFSNDHADPNYLASYLVNHYSTFVKKIFSLKKCIQLTNNPPVQWYTDNLRLLRHNLLCVKQIDDVTNDPNDLVAYKQLKEEYGSE